MKTLILEIRDIAIALAVGFILLLLAAVMSYPIAEPFFMVLK